MKTYKIQLHHLNLFPEKYRKYNKTETQPQTTSKTTNSVKENAKAQIIAASSQVEKTTTHTRSRRSATSPIASEGVLEDTTTTATPNMDDANGASVKSRDVVTPQPKDSNTIPTPNVVFEKVLIQINLHLR